MNSAACSFMVPPEVPTDYDETLRGNLAVSRGPLLKSPPFGILASVTAGFSCLQKPLMEHVNLFPPGDNHAK